jgi:putative FmdB family regulatory protein
MAQMPIYEFFCKPCNTIYKFFSQTVNTNKVPKCPKCGFDKLRRRPSLFATPKSSGKGKDGMDDNMPSIDEAKMEKAMGMLAKEAEKINEDDPRQAAQLMRKLSEAAGLKMGAGMEEALNRLEKGEDPDKIEEEIENLLENEDPFISESKHIKSDKKPKPRVDDKLYDL